MTLAHNTDHPSRELAGPGHTADPGSSIGPSGADRFTLHRAIRKPAPLLLGLSGPSGSGKTYSALRIATGMQRISGGEIVVIDTENGRARHYADHFAFQHIDMAPPFGSYDYATALDAAATIRPSVIIIDTLSHEHDGEGGMLDFCAAELERLAGEDPALQQRMQKAAWRRPRAARRTLLTKLMRLDAHCIVCFRASERTRPIREGASETPESTYAPIGGAEFIYEMTLSAILPPGASGVPLWASAVPGEQPAIKLPGQFASIFAREVPFAEAQGEAMARWAAGPPPALSPRRAGKSPSSLRRTSKTPSRPNAKSARAKSKEAV